MAAPAGGQGVLRFHRVPGRHGRGAQRTGGGGGRQDGGGGPGRDAEFHEGALAAVEGRDRRGRVQRLLPPDLPRLRRSGEGHPLRGRGADRVQGAALHPGEAALRHDVRRSQGRAAAVRAAGPDHGELRGAAAALPALHQGRGGLLRPAPERLPRDPAAEPHTRPHPQEHREADFHHAGRDEEGRIRQVRGFLQGTGTDPQGGDGAGLREPRCPHRPGRLRIHEHRGREVHLHG